MVKDVLWNMMRDIYSIIQMLEASIEAFMEKPYRKSLAAHSKSL